MIINADFLQISDGFEFAVIAKRHRIEPWTYVRDLLLRLHADDSRLEEMLPDRWAAAHPEAILSHRLQESRTKAIRTRARRTHRRARAR
jgi:transposase